MEAHKIIIIPFGDNQARGDLAHSVIYQRRRGQVMCRKYAVPRNPRSLGQVNQRSRFSVAVLAWQARSTAEQETWRVKATGMVMTGYNLFIRNFLLGLIPSGTPLLSSNFTAAIISPTRSPLPMGWKFDVLRVLDSQSFGHVFDKLNIYQDGTHPLTLSAVQVRVQQNDLPPNVQAGDRLLTSSIPAGTVFIYLPQITVTTDLYVGDDGATYYDVGLTLLAQAPP